MREIKFRAWNKEIKYMYTDEKDDDFPSQCFHTLRDSGEYTLMQYTGLKDKNGKEIYEGDVISTCNPSGTIRNSRPKIVKWTENRNHIGFNIAMQTHETKEIIGNIYENPELL